MKDTKLTNVTDCYFTKTRKAATHNPMCTWQVFQKKASILCGSRHLVDMLAGLNVPVRIRGLKDGADLYPGAPTHHITARLQDIVEAETPYLGVLARSTRIATNVRKAIKAAKGKPVLFFAGRFDVPETQWYDGYAAYIGGAAACATKNQTSGFNAALKDDDPAIPCVKPAGTMPHAMIAAFGGSTVNAALAFADTTDEPVWALVDFENDCSRTSVEVFKAFYFRGIAHRLAGVRLDTSEKLVDYGFNIHPSGHDVSLRGVNEDLVRLVRRSLSGVGAEHVKISVSGGFTPEKIERFESSNTPVDVYAIGEGFLAGSNAFTSDIVLVDGVPSAKVGRFLSTEPDAFEKLYETDGFNV